MAHWAITWTACWSAISAPRQEAIEAYLQEKIPDLQGTEINQAVEQIASTWDAKAQGNAPGIGLLISVIKGARRRKGGIAEDEPYEYTIRARNLRHADPRDRWDVICDIATACGSELGFRAEQLASTMQGGFILPWWVSRAQHKLAAAQDPKPANVTGWASCLAEAEVLLTDKNDYTESDM